MLGDILGSYRITGRLSEGGMGAVYRAEHVLLGRVAAVKMLLPEWSQNPEVVQRFFNEARATSSIRHPGIVEIFDFGTCALGRAYLVMELLSGEPLSQRLVRTGPMGELEAVLLVHRVAAALAAAHARGIVHRDLKPDNVFLVPDDAVPGGERPKLLDFGIAKLAAAAGSAGATRIGVVLGTPTYMSPEQCRGSGDVDARADVYSLGCILYELIAGRPPFVANGSGELIGAHLYVTPEPLRWYAPHASEAIEALVMRMLAKQPEARPAGALDVAAELAEIAAHAPGANEGGWRSLVPTPAPLPPGPTTLRGAAGATPTPPPVIAPVERRRWPAVAIGGGLVVAAALAAVMLMRRPDAPPNANSGPAARVQAPIDAGVAPIDAGADAPIDAGADASTARPAPPAPPKRPHHHPAQPPRHRPPEDLYDER